MKPNVKVEKPKTLNVIQLALSKKLEFARSEFYRVLDEGAAAAETVIIPNHLSEIGQKKNPMSLGWLIEPIRGFLIPIYDGVNFFEFSEKDGLIPNRANEPMQGLRMQVVGEYIKIDMIETDGSSWRVFTNDVFTHQGLNYIVKLLPKKYLEVPARDMRFSSVVNSLSAAFFMLSLFASAWMTSDARAEGTSFTSQAQVMQSQDENGKIRVEINQVLPPSANLQYKVFDSNGNKLSIEQDKFPVKIWVLTDVSTLCAPKKMGTFTNTLLGTLKDSLHPQSRLSLATYSSQGNTVMLSDVPLSGGADAKVRCQSQNLSSDFSSLITTLAQKEAAGSLPVYVWVFTSGNVHLDATAIHWIKKLNLRVHVYLYNPILIEQVRTAFDSLSQSMGKNHFQVSPVDSETQLGALLEDFYQIKILTPLSIAGKEQKFRILGISNQQEISDNSFTAMAPDRVYRHSLQKYAAWIAVGAAALFVSILLICLVLYYKPKSCKSCRRWIRHSQGDCLFCPEVGNAVLIENHPANGQGHLLNTGSVFLIRDGKTEVGSHRKSRIPLRKRSGESARAFFEIEKIQNQTQHLCYRLKRVIPQSLLDIQVNGIGIQEERLLASGDRIQFRNSEITFYCMGKKS
jgi:hypothetical protein